MKIGHAKYAALASVLISILLLSVVYIRMTTFDVFDYLRAPMHIFFIVIFSLLLGKYLFNFLKASKS